ncbi:type II toxin-antitoxin system VapB family antitoxin [Allohahella sp. A8]|uniref:type II toxin-antitoxin system VapB family antitoxin n=1 Tax=Allohahella sp. A8 TaxID=3141461 RepID=UPI003A80EC97
MRTGTVFEDHRTQAVRLPADTRFPADVKKVSVRVVGKDRIISPVENTWDSFSRAHRRSRRISWRSVHKHCYQNQQQVFP